jgi:hypothetical protein
MSPLKRTFWLGAGLIVVSNVLALGGVFYNRSGEPDSVLRLSERELSMVYNPLRDDSDLAGQVLELEVRVAKGWVTPDKLTALGFDMGENGTVERRDRIERDGFVVLEQNGAGYQAALAAVELELKQEQDTASSEAEQTQAQPPSAEYELERLRDVDTRLYVVDADLDAARLRERYPDRSRYSVVRASLRMGWEWERRAPRDLGYLLYVDLADLSVPGQWRPVFSRWHPYDRSAEERNKVSVELAFGKRFEPWITAAETVE